MTTTDRPTAASYTVARTAQGGTTYLASYTVARTAQGDTTHLAEQGERVTLCGSRKVANVNDPYGHGAGCRSCTKIARRREAAAALAARREATAATMRARYAEQDL